MSFIRVIKLVVKINWNRLATIAEALKPLKQLVYDLYVKDPQYIAVKKLVELRGCGEASLLVLLNSLVSYKLRTTGEEYWTRFAVYFSDRARAVDELAFANFLDWSGNNVLKEQKLSRIRRVLTSELPAQLLSNPLSYCSKIPQLVDQLSRVTKSERESKTISFAAKMYGYVCLACGTEVDYGEIGIPLDYRTAVLTLTSCMAECTGTLDECTEEILSGKGAMLVKEAWKTVCSITEIPCPYLDTLTWLVTGVLLKHGFNTQNSLAEIRSKYLVGISNNILELFSECASKYVRR